MDKIQNSDEALIYTPVLRSRECDSPRRMGMVSTTEITPIVAFIYLTSEIISCCMQIFPVTGIEKISGKLMDKVMNCNISIKWN